MKIYGNSADSPNESAELESVTIQADPNSLRRIAEFIQKCADQMEADEDWEHEHIQDWIAAPGQIGRVDLIIYR